MSDTALSHGDESQSVLDILKSKHPSGQPVDPTTLVDKVNDPPAFHPIIFDSIYGKTIRSAALRTKGAAGPSGIDAHGWRRICTSFKSASDDICHSLAPLTRKICTTFVDPEGLSPLLACRLIALNKNPGVRPIGICETVRRIVAKAVLTVTSDDIQDAAGSTQLCAGQTAGTEAAVHAMNLAFNSKEENAVLLVDASNAFNSLNHQTALRNVRVLCPSISTILINTYRQDTELFVDGSTLLSQEGTTQGDPLAMPMYAIALKPLMDRVNQSVEVTQAWYADDAAATSDIPALHRWWEELTNIGPAYGYMVNASKTHLIVKASQLSEAQTTFEDTQINITTIGKPHLGSPLGSQEFTESFVRDKVQTWSEELKKLSIIANTHPQAAYAAFTHGIVGKWTYLARTTPNIGPLLQPLEDIIRTKLLPALCGRAAPNDTERDLLELPARLGGIGVINPTTLSDSAYSASKQISAPLYNLILNGSLDYTHEALTEQFTAKLEVKKRKRELNVTSADQLKSNLPPNLQRAMILSQEKGASNWLTVLPVEEFGLALHKAAFRDALALRYGWQPNGTPITCACGTNFSVEHALSCAKGGYPSIRHNEIRDFTANLMSEVCHNVAIEPHLQPITGEILSGASANTQDGARLDVAADGFWGSRFERAFFDVRVFNPYAPSNRQPQLSTTYRKHENIKKRAYDQRIRDVENSTFTPLILSSTGGLGRAATSTYKRLASLLSTKWDQPYSTTMGWIRCRLSFSLLRSAIMCIRGARSSQGHATRQPPIDLVTSESLVPPHP